MKNNNQSQEQKINLGCNSIILDLTSSESFIFKDGDKEYRFSKKEFIKKFLEIKETELKTLKDLNHTFDAIDVKEIREKDINWVKEILKHKEEEFTIMGRTHFINEWLAILDFIIFTNNLTDEDLS